MVCNKCGSDRVNVVMDTSGKVNNPGVLARLGRLILIFCTFGLWIFVPKRKANIKTKPVALCQNCGNKQRV